MERPKGKLFFFSGKMAAGKSTLARQLAAREDAILLSQDSFIETLFPHMVVDVTTYLDYSGRINTVVAPLVVNMLMHGVSVVLDFPANTVGQRAWFREIISRAGVEHELHFVDTADAICKAQLRSRSAHLPPGTKWTTDADFELISSHFRAPGDEEGFTVVRHTRE